MRIFVNWRAESWHTLIVGHNCFLVHFCYSVLKNKNFRKYTKKWLKNSPQCQTQRSVSGVWNRPSCVVSSESVAQDTRLRRSKTSHGSAQTLGHHSWRAPTQLQLRSLCPFSSPFHSSPVSPVKYLEFSYISVSFSMVHAAMNKGCFYLSLCYIRVAYFTLFCTLILFH